MPATPSISIRAKTRSSSFRGPESLGARRDRAGRYRQLGLPGRRAAGGPSSRLRRSKGPARPVAASALGLWRLRSSDPRGAPKGGGCHIGDPSQSLLDIVCHLGNGLRIWRRQPSMICYPLPPRSERQKPSVVPAKTSPAMDGCCTIALVLLDSDGMPCTFVQLSPPLGVS